MTTATCPPACVFMTRCSPSPASRRCTRRPRRSTPVGSRPMTSRWTCPSGRRELEARVSPSGPNEVTAIVRDFTDVRAVEAEVRRSRARIVEATDSERRRLERDLHDGAQQRLVSVSLALRRVRARLDAAGCRRHGSDCRRGRRRLGAEARDPGAARAGARDSPGDPDRGRPGCGDHGPRRPLGRPRHRSIHPGSAASTSGRGDGLLHRVRGARQRRKTRGRDERSASPQRARRPRSTSRSATTASAAPMPRAGRASEACRIASPRSAARSGWKARRARARWSSPRSRSARGPSQGLPGSSVRELPRRIAGSPGCRGPSSPAIVCSSIGRHPADEEGASR